MRAAPLPRPLRGIITPLVTPLLGRDWLDVPGLERLVERTLRGGVHALFVLGSTGEGPSLTPELRTAVITRVCDQVAGRVPVLVAISDTCFSESIRLAGKASDAGASALVLAPPFYFPAAQSELLDYLECLVPELSLPVLLYNAPSFTKLSFQAETVQAAAAIPNVVGLKDSSGDRIYFQHVTYLLRDCADFTLLVGPEELLADTVLCGGHGGVAGGANVWPQLYVALYNAALTRDLRLVAKLHALVMYINVSIYKTGSGPSSVSKAIKYALSFMDVCQDTMAEPLQRFSIGERETLRERIKEFVSLLSAEYEADLGQVQRPNSPQSL